MILLIILAAVSAILLCVCKAFKKTVLKILAIISFSLFMLAVGWVLLWHSVLKEESPDPKVIEAIKSFDWTDEKKISNAGIKVDELSNGGFGMRLIRDEGANFYLVGGSLQGDKYKQDHWITDGELSYYYEITSSLNDFLIPDETEYSYWFEIDDVWFFVQGDNNAFEENVFERFVLEELK